MPDKMMPSEFGGKTTKQGIQPAVMPTGQPGHTPTEAEAHTLYLRTGDESGLSEQDNENSHFNGLLPYEQKVKEAKDAGLLDRGVL
jgi:hypothetical protein